jgi:short subunit dehydrogenase-like uncharacterized protein
LNSWLLYGATGYTGELIAREAASRNSRPILAGRNAAAVERLAGELACESRVFPLDNPDSIARHLDGVSLVLNCAGPFSATARPMMQACLAKRAHYLDITGEIEVFELGYSFDAQARRANVVVCPGVGFDVVPSDCLAATLKEALPTATHLALGFDSRSAPSRGTAKTMIESLRTGSQVRTDGRIVSIPFASRVREIDFGDGVKLAMAIPWGDVSTAFRSTGIPNIEVYIPASPGTVRRMQRLNRWRWLAGSAPVQWWLKRRIAQGPAGPDTEQRERTPVSLWGEARDSSRTVMGRMRVANGYTVTVHASLGIVERVLQGPVSAGFRTASQLTGADFATRLPGSTPIELRRD